MSRMINPALKPYQLPEVVLNEVISKFFKTTTDWESSFAGRNFDVGQIVTGRVVSIVKDEVTVDIGYKSEGVIDAADWYDDAEGLAALAVGQNIDVLLDTFDDANGQVVLSKKKADRLRAWKRVVSASKEGDEVSGKVVKAIRGGLLVDIGVLAFLPASQVSNRRAKDINEFIGQELSYKIIKIDDDRQNIVVSRRELLREHGEVVKKHLLGELVEGETREGVVKNIAEFGAFVDLGGIDGLLHITDMSWGRVSHPSEVVKVEQKIQVKVLKVDRERERIALGLKQLQSSPWENIEAKYPVGARVKGSVTNVMSYGAFVRLEDGIEGLVHISEMSWTKRIQDPKEVVQKGQEVEVVVLGINKEKEEISLGMKQVNDNPWNSVAEKYPVGNRVKGKVRNLTTYGAFVELEEGIDGLLHVSDMSWTKKVADPKEVVKKGDEIECVVLSVDVDKKRIALGLKQLAQDPWDADIPGRYVVGSIFRGKITKLTNFGVFVELETDLEGLLHVSELSVGGKTIKNPEEVVKVGQKLDVKVIKVDPKERKIGLTLAVPMDQQNLEGDAPSAAVAALIDRPRPTAPTPVPAEVAAAKPAAAAPQAGTPKKAAEGAKETPAQTSVGAALAEAMAAKKAARDQKK